MRTEAKIELPPRLRRAVFLLVAGVACFATQTALGAEKRDLSGPSPALTRLQEATRGLQLTDPGQLGQVAQEALGLESGASLQLERTNKLPNGKEVSRFEQTFRGIPIWGERVIVTRSPDGAVERLGGKAVYDLGVSFQEMLPAVTSAQALEKAKQSASELKGAASLNSFTDTNIRQVVYVEDLGAPHVAYEVSFLALTSGSKPEPTRPFVIVDAQTGLTLRAWEGLAYEAIGTGSGGNALVGKYEYGKGELPTLDITKNDKTCNLKNPNVFTEDMHNAMEERSGEPVSFPCLRNDQREVKGSFSALNDAHFFGTEVFQMYKEWYSVAPLTFPLHMRVHYGTNFPNAFWNSKEMTFGDGPGETFPWVTPDIAAHEIGHGFTEQHSGLHYMGEAGGINEAYSDMAGETFEYYLAQKYPRTFGANKPDFLIGEDMFKTRGHWVRDFCTPERDGRSIGNVRDYKFGMNPHLSSGIFNKAFCRLAKTKGWDVRKAFDVFFVANQNLWVLNSTFVSAARDVLEAAGSLNYDVAAVAAAFREVGIDLPTSGSAPAAVASVPVPGKAITLGYACSYFGEILPNEVKGNTNIGTDPQAANIIQRIVDVSGLARNFEILAEPVPNAAAVTQDGVRYILYNPSFISDIGKATRTKWAAISILAHEAGHHLNGHTLTSSGSRPDIELEADLFSGFIVERLGGSLADATAVMELLGNPNGSPTHPPKKDRLAAITKGWTNACEKDPDCFREPAAAESETDSVPSTRAPAQPSDLGAESPEERGRRTVIHQ